MINKIRNYKKKDKDSILQLIDINTPKYFALEEKKDLVYYLDNELEDYFVIEQSGQVIGCGGVNYEDDFKTGIISWDIIHSNFQGRGIGRQLLNHRIDLLRSKKTVNKIVVRTSQLTDKFYEKSGFHLQDVKKDYWAEGFDLYYMVLTIS